MIVVNAIAEGGSDKQQINPDCMMCVCAQST